MSALKAAAAGIIGALVGAWAGGVVKNKVAANFNVMGKDINVADAAAGAAILAASPFVGRSSMVKTGLAALGGAMLAKADPESASISPPPSGGWYVSPDGLGL
jgi:predicted anti-sigma-YlaC factor YlaD